MLFRFVEYHSQIDSIDCRHSSHRCQTCEQAFCEDCLPSDDIDAIGDVLPELCVLSFVTCTCTNSKTRSLLLDYGEKASAYYIRCSDCRKHFEKHPKHWLERQEEFAETQKKLDRKYALDL